IQARAATERPTPVALLYQQDYAAAWGATKTGRGKFFGHDSWQPLQAYIARALAESGVEDSLEPFRTVGYLFEGGSLRGHRLALLALLGESEPLAARPAIEDGPADRLVRAGHRNTLLRPKARPDAEMRLSTLTGRRVSKRTYNHKHADPALAFEAAFAARDFTTAERLAKRMANHRPSWMDTFSGRTDPRANGALGLARVKRARGVLTLTLKHVRQALEYDKTDRRALVLSAGTALELGLEQRALSSLRTLKKHHPFSAVDVDDLSRDEVERRAKKVDRRRQAAALADECFLGGEYREAAAHYARLFARTRAVTTPVARYAARWLYALAMLEEWTELAAVADGMVVATPDFVSAREALAFARGQLRDTKRGSREFDATGLGQWFTEDWPYRVWRKEAACDALSPLPAWATDRATGLFVKGAEKPALQVMKTIRRLPASSPLRFLAAGTIHRRGTLSSKKRRHRLAEEAWGWLEPLAMKPPKDHLYLNETPVLAIDILATAERWEDVVRVPLPEDIEHYPALTNRAFARLLPRRHDGLLALGKPRRVLQEIDAAWESEHESERMNRAWRIRYRKAQQQLGQPPLSLDGTEDSPDDRAREHTDRGWAHDQRGDVDEALEHYLSAAELNPSIAAIGLANAGNLLTSEREFSLALEFLHTALMLVVSFPFGSRAGPLSQTGRWFTEQGKYADALPALALAFEANASAARAAALADCYLQLGDRERAQAAIEAGNRIEPRDPKLRMLRRS
ncbi:MAG: tetratricopeptide repeat protein, partial [Myxococcota bacterium]